MIKKIIFKGTATAIVTPFNDDLTINYNKVSEIIEIQIKNEIEAIVIAGTTGEASSLSKEEYKNLIDFVVKSFKNKIKIIAGAGSNDTKKAIDFAKIAENCGVDALLCITPYYNKANKDGIYQHFYHISKSVEIPIILYNVPSRTNVDIEIETYKKLSLIKNIVAVKEASEDISKILKIKNECGKNLNIYTGNDNQILPSLACGAIGVISVCSNIIPKETNDICKLFFENKVQKAIDIQTNYINFINILFKDVSPIPIKTAMNIKGMDVGQFRLPLCLSEEYDIKSLKLEMENLNII